MSFATDYGDDESRPGTLTARGTFVPPWYRPHLDPHLAVLREDGTPLGFRIREVAPERRWAIADDGRVMNKHDFRDRLQEWYEGQWKWRSPPQPPLDVSLGAFPTPEGFVSKGVDPRNPLRLYDLSRATPRHLRNVTTERPVDPAALALPGSGWKPAPAREPAAVAAAEAPPEPEVEQKRKRPPATLLSCDICGQAGLKGKNGVRFHKQHKHKGI